MKMGDAITVHKLDHRGAEVWRYQGTVTERTPSSLTLEAFFDRESQTIGGLTLRRGDRFVETYFTDRWYNIFAIHDRYDGLLKGWYCNIARPARIERGDLFADDLALDLVVDRLGRWVLLDQDEFDELELSEEDRGRAMRALEELQHLVATAAAPFTLLE
jgi:predicted RNA-binding protein associated with RNAse of E/G family